tara:strand:- start:172 stop:354 length:183 start_codon:yes stop_codon:yes gene_type:complete
LVGYIRIKAILHAILSILVVQLMKFLVGDENFYAADRFFQINKIFEFHLIIVFSLSLESK